MDVKSFLKDARESIKNKEFSAALKSSKEVLKLDKNNYMALVFTAICLQEVGPARDAPKYFEKAISLNDTNLLAYQGLVNYYEKNNDEKETEALLAIYQKILQLETNEVKILEIVRKLALHKETHFNVVVKALYNGVNNSNLSDVFHKEACCIVLNLLCSIPQISQDYFKIYKDCYNSITENEKKKEFYLSLFKILYEEKEYKELIEECERMHQQYPSNCICLELICNLFIEFYIEDDEQYKTFLETTKKTLEDLEKLASENFTLIFTKSLFLYKSGNILECKEMLEKVISNFYNSPYSLLFLTRIYIELHFYNEAILLIKRVTPLLQKQENKKLEKLTFDYTMLSFCHSNHKEDLKIVIELSKKADENYADQVIYAQINLNEIDEAEKTLEKLSTNKEKYIFSKAQILIAKSKHAEALKLLEENPLETSMYWLTVGDLFWKLEMYQKSLTPYLKAAKLNQNSFKCFERLGNFYQKVGDFDKARRCYEKSFKINGTYKAAGEELSKMYRKLQKWEENLNLLLNLTTNKISPENVWAFVQLGIHYLEQKDFHNAVDTLRHVIRFDPNNSYYCESLGDAYLYRGAYTSALKCFERSAELMPESLYPKLQMANIKKSIGDYAAAKDEFLNVLAVDSNYVPALKGLAETFYLLSKIYKRNQIHGLARKHAQLAVEYITTALQNTSNLSCLWKICGDTCYLVAKLPEKFSFLLVNSKLLKESQDESNTGLMREELYQFASRCYCKAISLTENNMLIYHDLACCYLSHSKIVDSANERAEFLEKAFRVAQFCVTNNPTYWQHWNLFGNIAFCSEPKNLAVAQHSFIKAVTLEHNSALAWSNLGALYLYLDDFKLANEAFSKAQRSDPNYINSWVGQALLAEMVDVDEAMDLFRHTTQLGQHQQGSIGYGYWVCKKLLENLSNKNIYAIYNMHAIPIACDALTWFTDHNPYDPCAWNLLGVLRERMGLKLSAKEAFNNAAKFSHDDRSLVNLGRSLMNLEQCEEAIKTYGKVSEPNFNSRVGLALAYFKNKNYEESFETYKSALETENQESQSDLLVALASMTYLFQDAEHAKNLLFQSTQLEQRSPWSLYATLALGLLHDDANLAQLALNEIEALKDKPDCLPHYATLLTYTWLQQGDYKKALSDLSKLVYRHPNQASLWLTLSELLLRIREVKPITKAVANCANAAMKLGRTDIDVTNVLLMVSLASLLAGDYKEGLKSIQRAIHCYPNIKHGWTLLKVALSCN